jgi:thioredoxin-like negative regulator of GroEL
MVESKFPELKLVLVNSEFYPDIPAHFGIFSNPAILLFIQGKEYHRASKYVSESQLSETIGRLYEMAFN